MSNFNHSNIRHIAISNYELKANREKNKPRILNPELLSKVTQIEKNIKKKKRKRWKKIKKPIFVRG